MTKVIKIFISGLISFVIASTAFAESKGSKESEAFQASFTPAIALHDRDQKIEGFTISLWGENLQEALALGVINGSKGDSAGVSIGFVNYGDSYRGAQFGFINSDNNMNGAQFGFLNFTKTTETGIQFGLLNIIKENKKWFKNFPNEIAPVMLFVNWRTD